MWTGLSLTILIPVRAAPPFHPEDQLLLGMHGLHTPGKILKSGIKDFSNVPRSLSSFLILPFPERLWPARTIGLHTFMSPGLILASKNLEHPNGSRFLRSWQTRLPSISMTRDSHLVFFSRTWFPIPCLLTLFVYRSLASPSLCGRIPTNGLH